jgi:ATP-dependent exoDNAse (exonuclease V) alpha subunit
LPRWFRRRRREQDGTSLVVRSRTSGKAHERSDGRRGEDDPLGSWRLIPEAVGSKRNADNPLDCDLLVVDEASMVNVLLMQALMKAIPDDAALLIVGDIGQRPLSDPGRYWPEDRRGDAKVETKARLVYLFVFFKLKILFFRIVGFFDFAEQIGFRL